VSLNIQILYFESIVFDEFTAWLYRITHENRENVIRVHGVLDLNLE
jgi:hypothetical protein